MTNANKTDQEVALCNFLQKKSQWHVVYATKNAQNIRS